MILEQFKESIMKEDTAPKIAVKLHEVSKEDRLNPDSGDEEEENTAEEVQQSERLLAAFCLQSSRVYVQILQFLDESNYFKGSKFIYERKDMLKTIRGDIKNLREENIERFKNTIPIMDRYGKLEFDLDKIAKK